MAYSMDAYRPGEPVVYCVCKFSCRPGPRARGVSPAEHGDTYSYTVDKYWRVEEVLPDGRIVARTRRGKRHALSPDDPRLRRPTWWEWLLYWDRFPPLAAPQGTAAN